MPLTDSQATEPINWREAAVSATNSLECVMQELMNIDEVATYLRIPVHACQELVDRLLDQDVTV